MASGQANDSLHGNEDSYGGYANGPDRYLDTDDEDLQNLSDEEMNRSHQLVQDEDLTISDDEEDHYGENGVEEEEGPMHDDRYTEEQYTVGPVEVTKVILEYNHELEPALSYFLPCHRELSRTVKRSLVAHDIAGLRPSKSIRLLEVAIYEVLPNTCDLSHLYQATRKAWGVTNYKLAKACFKAIIFDNITIAEFEDKWQAFFEEYNLVHQHDSTASRCYSSLQPRWQRNFHRVAPLASFSVVHFPVQKHGIQSTLSISGSASSSRLRNDMAIPNILDSDSDTDVRIIRNPREVHSRGRPQINRNRSLRQYVFCGDSRRWGSRCYDVYEKGQSSLGRSGGERCGHRGGGVCGSREGRGDDANVSNHPTVHEFL
ncbi:hypothetical protein FXO37_36009 [Capsicum annuum]|nr:hypothetical protein FXO37_36009 [Capsicum annuum]